MRLWKRFLDTVRYWRTKLFGPYPEYEVEVLSLQDAKIIRANITVVGPRFSLESFRQSLLKAGYDDFDVQVGEIQILISPENGIGQEPCQVTVSINPEVLDLPELMTEYLAPYQLDDVFVAHVWQDEVTMTRVKRVIEETEND